MSVQEKRTELYVGLFVFIGLAIMAVLILQFGRFDDRFREKYKIYVTFPDATDLLEGASVRLGGAKIGQIAKTPELNEDYTGVVVELDIYSDKKIPRGASFSKRTSGLMGDSYVGIQAPTAVTEDFLQPNETVPGLGSADIQQIAATAEDLSKQASALITDLQDTVGTIREAVIKLDRTLEKLNTNILSEDNLANWDGTLEDIRKTSGNLKDATAKLPPLFDEAKSTVASANTTFDRASGILDDLGPTISEFQQTAENTNKAVEKINEGSGLLGALVNDPTLKDNFSALIYNLREHGVLWYKDSARQDGSKASDSSSPSSPPAAPSTTPSKKRGLFRKH